MYKLISKNNIGIVSTLLLLILVSQSNVLSFFSNTILGRSMLIMIILLISYTNQILGVVSVLIVIIMFNANIGGYKENFTNNIKLPAKFDIPTLPPLPTETQIDTVTNKLNKRQNKGQNKDKKYVAIPFVPPSTSSMPPPITNKITPITDTTSMANDTTNDMPLNTTEGFDLLGTENTLKRGKSSNSITVNNYMRESPNVVPYDSDKFTYLTSYL